MRFLALSRKNLHFRTGSDFLIFFFGSDGISESCLELADGDIRWLYLSITGGNPLSLALNKVALPGANPISIFMF